MWGQQIGNKSEPRNQTKPLVSYQNEVKSCRASEILKYNSGSQPMSFNLTNFRYLSNWINAPYSYSKNDFTVVLDQQNRIRRTFYNRPQTLNSKRFDFLFFLFAFMNGVCGFSFNIANLKWTEWISCILLWRPMQKRSVTITDLYRFLLFVSLFLRRQSVFLPLSLSVPIPTQWNCNLHISPLSSSLTELPSRLIVIHYLYLYSLFSTSSISFHFHPPTLRTSHWKSFFFLCHLSVTLCHTKIKYQIKLPLTSHCTHPPTPNPHPLSEIYFKLVLKKKWILWKRLQVRLNPSAG